MLYNKLSKQELIKRLYSENFKRVTLSFYRYIKIYNPEEFRNSMYYNLDRLGCFGRIYIAYEGINAQMSVPAHNEEKFMKYLNTVSELNNIHINRAFEDDGKSFYKLIIKIRPKIVTDGLQDESFDTSNVGKHLSAVEFHELLENPNVIVVDMRNNYESEIGRFENAICPDAVTFREEIETVTEILEDHKNDKVLLYCTGGIRCEKASAYLRHMGFSDINQLQGGILEYIRQIKKQNLSSKFIGKMFVFDNRMGERVTPDIISNCHQCGAICDTHVNCSNDNCHMLFIQCSDCVSKYKGCCSEECLETFSDPDYREKINFIGKRWRRNIKTGVFDPGWNKRFF